MQNGSDEKTKQKKRRIRSVLLLAVVIAAALCAILAGRSKESRLNAVISVDGKVYATLPLSEDTALTIEDGEGGYNRVVVANGAVFVAEANCANQVCVRTGAISQTGRVIACIPHGLVISLTTDSDGEVDTVAY